MPTFPTVFKAGVIIGALCASACTHAALIEYTRRAAFDAATTQRSVEPNQAPPNSFYFLGGRDFNGIRYPDYAYMVDPGYAPALYEWGSGAVLLLAAQPLLSLAPGTAFAVDFGTLPDGSPVHITIDGIAGVVGTPAQRQLSLRGWTSSTPFSTVALSTGAQLLILDNVTRGDAQIAPPPPTSVPSPAPLALTGLALLGIAALRRRVQ